MDWRAYPVPECRDLARKGHGAIDKIMQAAALFVIDSRIAGQLTPVQRSCGRSEKSESVKVGAADRSSFHNSGNFSRRKSQGIRVMTDLFGLLPIDHRPFMNAIASKERRTFLRRYD